MFMARQTLQISFSLIEADLLADKHKFRKNGVEMD